MEVANESLEGDPVIHRVYDIFPHAAQQLYESGISTQIRTDNEWGEAEANHVLEFRALPQINHRAEYKVLLARVSVEKHRECASDGLKERRTSLSAECLELVGHLF